MYLTYHLKYRVSGIILCLFNHTILTHLGISLSSPTCVIFSKIVYIITWKDYVQYRK